MAKEYEVPTWETGMRPLAPNVYAYVQTGGSWFRSNAGLIVGSEYAVVVDSLTTIDLTQGFIDEIRKITDKPVRYLINTHHHGDHTWGNHLFTGTQIICHRRCREQLLETEITDPDMLGLMFPEFDFHGIAATPPHITFESQMTLYVGDTEIQLIHHGPGHTVGDTIVYLPQESVVFAGDLLFLYSTPLCMQGYFAGWIDSMNAMVDLEAKSYVPGHGPVCGREGLIASRDYLLLIQEEARKRFDEGMSPDGAARDIDLGHYKKWAAWERILFNLERLQREFQGEEPTSKMDEADIMMRMVALAASL